MAFRRSGEPQLLALEPYIRGDGSAPSGSYPAPGTLGEEVEGKGSMLEPQ